VNVARIDVVYQKFDDNRFIFQITGDADNRNDYQVLAVSISNIKGGKRRKRAGSGNGKACPVVLPANLLQLANPRMPIISTIINTVYQQLINSRGIREIRPNSTANPIELSVVRTLTHGIWPFQRTTERVELVAATITPLHYRRNNRVDFPDSGNTSTTYMRNNLNAFTTDERGHVVASMFSGPPELYNMFPQHRGLNRNYRESHLLVDWYQTEIRMREFLENNRGYIRWEVALSYNDDNTGRPDSVVYDAIFYNFQNQEVDRITGRLRNCEGDMANSNGRSCGF